MRTASPHHGRTASCLAGMLAVMALCPSSAAAFHAARSGIVVQQESAGGDPEARPPFDAVVALVRRHGLPADLRRLCQALGLPQSCWFKQVAIDASVDGREHHGFNVPLQGTDTPYVLIFHLRPLVSEFFVASAQGELVAARFRAKGIDHTPLAPDEARRAFESEIAFWRSHFDGLQNNWKAWRVRPRHGRGTEP